MKTQVHIAAAPEAVFAVLADGAQYADSPVGMIPQPGWGIDQAIGHVVPVIRHRTEVRAVDAPHSLDLVAHAEFFHALIRFDLTADATGTVVVMEERGLDGVSQMLARLLRPLLLSRNAETLWRLKEQVENDGDVRRPTPAATETRTAVPSWLGDITARVFGLATAVRGRQIFHPLGVVRRGRVEWTKAGEALGGSGGGEAIVRFSRGLGLGAQFPDINGLALRIVDGAGAGRDRDLLLASAGPGPLGRVLVPARHFDATAFSSIVRYRLAGEPVVITASVRGDALTLDALANGAAASIELSASSGRSAFALGTLTVGDRMDGEGIRFDPTSADEHLVAVGFLNGLRVPAYAASQAIKGTRE